MSDKTERTFAILKRIPRHPTTITTAQLEEQLRTMGHEVSRRTLQRELNALSDKHPLRCELDGRTQYWCYAADAPQTSMPAMDPSMALAFSLLEKFLKHALPPSAVRPIAPHFTAARELLKRTSKSGYAQWMQKVRVFPRGIALAGPPIDDGVFATVSDALLHNRKIALRYRRRSEEAVKEFTVSPLGLVLRDHTAYLVGNVEPWNNAIQFALHRATRATILDDVARNLPGFTLDEWLASGEAGVLLGNEPIALVARFHKSVARTLLECTVAPDQHITAHDDGGLTLRATLPDTGALRAWLLGYGAFVEVLQPTSLRTEIAAALHDAAQQYR